MERRWIPRAVAAVGGGLAGLGIVLLLTGHGRDSWRADLSYDAYRCGPGDVCVLTNPRQRDATGREHDVQLNAMGFRGPDVPRARARPDTIRIQLYGDSMVFGTGVDDGDDLSGALARELAARHPERLFEVQNFGNPMNYLPSNLRTYDAYGRDFDPDIVVFSYLLTGHRDMNYRLMEIHRSPLAQALLPFAAGRWLLNAWQVRTAGWTSDADREQYLRQPLRAVARDVEQRGMAVVFWEFWASGFQGLDDIAPAALGAVRVSSNLDFETYRNSDLCIQGDGHPTPKGHRFFAARLADGLEPILNGPRLAARRGLPPPTVAVAPR